MPDQRNAQRPDLSTSGPFYTGRNADRASSGPFSTGRRAPGPGAFAGRFSGVASGRGGSSGPVQASSGFAWTAAGFVGGFFALVFAFPLFVFAAVAVAVMWNNPAFRDRGRCLRNGMVAAAVFAVLLLFALGFLIDALQRDPALCNSMDLWLTGLSSNIA